MKNKKIKIGNFTVNQSPKTEKPKIIPPSQNYTNRKIKYDDI